MQGSFPEKHLASAFAVVVVVVLLLFVSLLVSFPKRIVFRKSLASAFAVVVVVVAVLLLLAFRGKCLCCCCCFAFVSLLVSFPKRIVSENHLPVLLLLLFCFRLLVFHQLVFLLCLNTVRVNKKMFAGYFKAPCKGRECFML